MKIGFLLTAYNQEEFIQECVKDLIDFRKEDHLISCVSLPFKEYREISDYCDNTRQFMQIMHRKEKIDYLFTDPEYISEAEARNLALKPLLEAGCDYIILIDADESITVKDFQNIEKFIKLNNLISWFSISYRNYINDKNHYLDEPFCPPRVFKTKVGSYRIKEFNWDNDVTYTDKSEETEIDYKSLSSMKIPVTIANPKHYSWLDNENSRKKIDYQTLHFGHCGYKWEDDSVKFNEEYYNKHNLTIPNIIKE